MNAKAEILVVDDNAADVRLSLHALRRHGAPKDVAIVRDGEEALEYVFRTGRYANDVPSNLKLILLDLKLPKVDGFEVLRAVKGNESTRSIPVVVLSSSRQDRDLRESYRLGANSYVQKPVDFDRYEELIDLIKTYWLKVNHPLPTSPPGGD